MLIEHYAGWMPVWLAPQQVVVMNITDKQAETCENVVSELKKQVYVPLVTCVTKRLDLRYERKH